MSTPSSLLAPRVHGHLESTPNYNPQSDFLLQEVLSILFINFRPSSECMCIETYRKSSQDESSWEFPDGPVVKMLCFHSMDEVKSLVAELRSHDPHSQKEFLNIFVMSISDTGQALSH